MAAAEPTGADEQPWPGGGQEGVARLSEEIRLLVEMVVEHALPWLEELVAAGHGVPPGEEHDGTEGTEGSGEPRAAACEWCPLCAVIAVARGQRPDFAVRLFEQAAQVVALLRAVLADRWEPGEGLHMPGFRPSEADAEHAQTRHSPTRPASSPRVQHITVRRRGAGEPGSD